MATGASGTHTYTPDVPGHLYTFRATATDNMSNTATGEDQAGIRRVTCYHYHGG